MLGVISLEMPQRKWGRRITEKEYFDQKDVKKNIKRIDRERREFFPDHTEKDPSSRARRRKRGSSGCGRDSHASSRVETGMSGNFLSCSNGVKDPLEVPDVRCD